MEKLIETSDIHSKILFQWGIPDLDEEGNEKVWLTGSSYEYEIGWMVFLIDFWMFQWWSKAEEFNKKIPDVSKYDWIIITHAHIDHIWKLPMLYKAWYRWPVYMTEATSAVGREMMLDTAKIEQVEVEKRMGQGRRLREMLEKSMRLIKDTEKLKSDWLEVSQRNKIKSSISSIIWKNDLWIALSEATSLLKEYHIENQKDIDQVYNDMLEPLFTEEDVNGILQNVVLLEYGEETSVIAKKSWLKGHNQEKRNTLTSLPLHIQNWYNKPQKVTKREKNLLLQIWKRKQKTEKSQLEKEQSLRIEDNVRIIKTEKGFHNLLTQSYTFCFTTWPDIKLWLNEESDEYDVQQSVYEEHQQLLTYYNIETESDIQATVLRYGRPTSFLPTDYKIAESLLKVKNESAKEKKKSSITLTANNTAHVVWSAWITVKHYSEKPSIVGWLQKSVNQSAEKILDNTGESTTVHFWWDLWRYNKSNRLGTPEIPYHPVDWLQIESTYGWKNHPSRTEAVGNLMNSIDNSSGDVLISAFSQQRAQELGCTILEELAKKKESGTLWDDVWYDIYIDGPLSQKITELYFKFEWKIYNILKESTQTDLFGRVIIRFLEEWEMETLYEKWSRKKVIIASSGMADAWAILAHMPHILPSKSATLIAPWYLSEKTLGNDIVIQWIDSANIWGENYNVACKTEQIQWFSSHIWHDEILTYVWKCIKDWIFKEDSTIALTHGSRDWAEILQKDIYEMLKYNEREDVTVTIPELFSEFDVSTHRFLEGNKEKKSVNSLLENNKNNLQIPSKWRIVKPKKIPKFLEHIEPVITKTTKPNVEDKNEKLEVEEVFNPTESQEYIRDLNRKSSFVIEEYELLCKRSNIELLKNLAKNTDLENFLREIYTLSKEQKNLLFSVLNAKQKHFKDTKSSFRENAFKRVDLTGISDIYSELFEENSEEVEKHIWYIIELEFELNSMQELELAFISSMSQLEKNISDLRNQENWKKEIRKKSKKLLNKKQESHRLRKKIAKKETEIQKRIIECFTPLFNVLQNQEQGEELLKISNNIFWWVSKKLLSNLQFWDDNCQEIYEILTTDRKLLNSIQSLFLRVRKKQQQLDEKTNRIKELESQLEDSSIVTSSTYLKIQDLENDITDIKWHIDSLISTYFPSIDSWHVYSILEKVLIWKTSENFFTNNDKIQTFISNVWLRLDTEHIALQQECNTIWDIPVEIDFRKVKSNSQNDKNTWNDFDFNSNEFKAIVLNFLSSIFEAQYYDKCIKDNFDIFHFLLSSKNIFEYIHVQYDISKIGIIKENETDFSKTLEDLEWLLDLWIEIESSAWNVTDKWEMWLYIHWIKENHREIKNRISLQNW